MINDLIEEFLGVQSPFFLFLRRKNIFYRRKKVGQAAEGIWTPDLLITNQPLHQLSYGGILGPE
jgi:hypothetical protein